MGPKQNTEELTRNMEIVQQEIGELKSLRDDIAEIKEFMAFMKEKMVKDERAKEKEPMRDEVTASGTSSGELQRSRPIEEIPGDARAIQNLVGEEKDKTSPVVQEESDGLGNKERKETHEEEEAKLKSNEMNIHACQVFDKMSLEKNGSVRRRKKRKSTKAKRSRYKCGKLVMRFMKKKKQRTRLEMHERNCAIRDLYVQWLKNSKLPWEDKTVMKRTRCFLVCDGGNNKQEKKIKERDGPFLIKRSLILVFDGGNKFLPYASFPNITLVQLLKIMMRPQTRSNATPFVTEMLQGVVMDKRGLLGVKRQQTVLINQKSGMVQLDNKLTGSNTSGQDQNLFQSCNLKVLISMDRTRRIWQPGRKMGTWVNIVVCVGELSHYAFGSYNGHYSLDGVLIRAQGYARNSHLCQNVRNSEKWKFLRGKRTMGCKIWLLELYLGMARFHVWHRWKNKGLQCSLHGHLIEQKVFQEEIQQVLLSAKKTRYSSCLKHVSELGEHKKMSIIAKVINVSLLGTMIWITESDTCLSQQEYFEKITTGNERLSKKWFGYSPSEEKQKDQVLQGVVFDVRAQTTQKQRKFLKTWMFKYREEREATQQRLGRLKSNDECSSCGNAICSSEKELNDMLYGCQYRIQSENNLLLEEIQPLMGQINEEKMGMYIQVYEVGSTRDKELQPIQEHLNVMLGMSKVIMDCKSWLIMLYLWTASFQVWHKWKNRNLQSVTHWCWTEPSVFQEITEEDAGHVKQEGHEKNTKRVKENVRDWSSQHLIES